ncbi:uncharacterized protein LOC143197901 isoform X2 [Rhynchophorus ferrugineus]|uniref:uncharacterized protein LOC143197901 isoform X2 n=1 Tax=Rhynchophorus ferrugineus TaxID=354439 RepID=UPI003FCD7C2D
MNIPTLAIFGIVGWMIVTFNDAKTYTFIKGLKWVTVCADRHGNMIVCPKGSNYCSVNTCISTTDNEKTLSSFLQCLNGSRFNWAWYCGYLNGDKLLCPKGSTNCYVETTTSITRNENKITSLIQCLNGTEILKADTYTSLYPYNCDQNGSNQMRNTFYSSVLPIPIIKVRMDEI